MGKLFLSQNLKFLRKKSGLKQLDIQDMTGFKRNTWSNWENNISEPSAENILKISEFFDISVKKLLIDDLSKGDLKNERPKKMMQKKGDLKGDLRGDLNEETEGNAPGGAIYDQLVASLESNLHDNRELIAAKNELIDGLKSEITRLSKELQTLKKEIPQLHKDMENRSKSKQKKSSA